MFKSVDIAQQYLFVNVLGFVLDSFGVILVSPKIDHIGFWSFGQVQKSGNHENEENEIEKLLVQNEAE